MKNFQSCYDKYDPRRTFCPNPITTDFHLVILNVTIDCNLYDSIVMIKTAQTLSTNFVTALKFSPPFYSAWFKFNFNSNKF